MSEELITAGRVRGAALNEAGRVEDGMLMQALADGWANALLVVDQWWMRALRQEAANSRYATAVAAKDAAGLLALLRTPHVTYPDPAPVAAVMGDLSELGAVIDLSPAVTEEIRTKWDRVITRQTTFAAKVSVIPRDKLTGLALAARADGLVPAAWEPGSVEQSRLEELGLAGVVTAPAHVARAMGEGW